MGQDSRHAPFPRTRTSLVELAADPESPAWKDAWERFFRDYWRPLYAYLRRSGSDSQAALDQLQEFFVAGLQGNLLGSYDASRGRLRSFLVTCLSNHRRKEWRRENARPDRAPLPWLVEQGSQASEPADGDPDEAFERDWTRCLQERVLQTVCERLEQRRDSVDLAVLRRWVLASDRPSAEALANELGLKRGALYTRATRLRQTLIEEVERRLRWLQVHPEALASERDAILRAFREPA